MIRSVPRALVLRVTAANPMYFHEWSAATSPIDELQAAVLRVKLKYLDG